MKTTTIYILFLSILFVQCRKDDLALLPAGIQTTVAGKLTDFQDSPIVKAKIRVGEYKQQWHTQSPYGGNYFDEFVQWLSLAETNSNGE